MENQQEFSQNFQGHQANQNQDIQQFNDFEGHQDILEKFQDQQISKPQNFENEYFSDFSDDETPQTVLPHQNYLDMINQLNTNKEKEKNPRDRKYYFKLLQNELYDNIINDSINNELDLKNKMIADLKKEHDQLEFNTENKKQQSYLRSNIKKIENKIDRIKVSSSIVRFGESNSIAKKFALTILDHFENQKLLRYSLITQFPQSFITSNLIKNVKNIYTDKDEILESFKILIDYNKCINMQEFMSIVVPKYNLNSNQIDILQNDIEVKKFSKDKNGNIKDYFDVCFNIEVYDAKKSQFLSEFNINLIKYFFDKQEIINYIIKDMKLRLLSKSLFDINYTGKKFEERKYSTIRNVKAKANGKKFNF